MSDAGESGTGASATPNGPDGKGDVNGSDEARGGRRRHWLGPSVVVLLGVAFVVLIAVGVASQSSGSSIDDRLAQGRSAAAPSFTLALLAAGSLGPDLRQRVAPVLADGRVSLSQLRGIPVVLNIWASWCEPCRQEAPVLAHAWRTEGRPTGTLFVGLDQQDAATDARRFIRSFGIGYLNLHDTGNDVPRRYGATGVPETFFISARGRIVDHVVGAIAPAQLRDGIAAARRGLPLGTRRGGAHRTSR